MPRAGLEPARLAAPPPQDGVSTSSTTWACSHTAEPTPSRQCGVGCFGALGTAPASGGVAASTGVPPSVETGAAFPFFPLLDTASGPAATDARVPTKESPSEVMKKSIAQTAV